jgi:hypothetical protein
MLPGQDWCLQCGAGIHGGPRESGWRWGAAILAIAAALVLGAAAAGYAALTTKDRKAAVVVQTVARAPLAAPTTPTTPPGATTTAPGTIPNIKAKPPKIPLAASTPKVSTPTAIAPVTPITGTDTPSTNTTGTTGTGGASGEGATKAILLDTNAASTYNPYNYPAAKFGDPALAIDGDESTGWTARVEAASAPRLAEGLLIDLKTARRLKTLALVTTTPGMTVQVYGSSAKKVPASITDPGWVALSHATKDKKRKLTIPLHNSSRSFRFVTLWISSAPSTSTPAKPGRVTVNELELFPAG